MSMYGAHVTTQDIRGQKRATIWSGYGSWAGCFAGLSRDTVTHLRDDQTAIATVALANITKTRGEPSKAMLAQRAFLFGPFAQRLTDSAFIAWEEPDLNTPLYVGSVYNWGHRDSGVAQVINSTQNVHFIPHRHQDLLVTAFRISKQGRDHGVNDWVTPEDYESWTLAQALLGADGYTYSDSGVVFGTPRASRIQAMVTDLYRGDFSELDCDDLDSYDFDSDFPKLTEDGLEDMLRRTTEEFRSLCRQGMPDLISGYTKDCELSREEFEGLRPDDPIGLAAPMRFTKKGGRDLSAIGIRQLTGIIKEILRG